MCGFVVRCTPDFCSNWGVGVSHKRREAAVFSVLSELPGSGDVVAEVEGRVGAAWAAAEVLLRSVHYWLLQVEAVRIDVVSNAFQIVHLLIISNLCHYIPRLAKQLSCLGLPLRFGKRALSASALQLHAGVECPLSVQLSFRRRGGGRKDLWMNTDRGSSVVAQRMHC